MSLLLWIYDNDGIKERLLEEWFRIKLDDAQVQDVGKKQRPATRQVCDVAMEDVNKASKNSPIILALFTFNIFYHYITTIRKNNQ